MSSRLSFRFLFIGTALLSAASVAPASAFDFFATANLVTNTKNRRNEMPTLDKKGQVLVFVSNSDHVSGVLTSPAGTFDYDETGNDFATSAAQNPVCTNCTAVDDGAGNLYLWRAKKKGDQPANSIKQLTFTEGGSFDVNAFPDMDSKADWVVWTSEADHVGTNADENAEVFLLELDTDSITQLTNSTGGSGNANRTATISDKGRWIAFDSTRDYNSNPSCRRPDGVTPCLNADNNSEVMVYNRETGALTQVTDTTGDGNDAQQYPRISSDGNYIVFQSSRDFSGPLSGGVTCVGTDGGLCSNDGNGEIMLYDFELRQLTQVTNTIDQAGCNDRTSNERPEVSKKAKYIVWQSECEDQLNPTGCGACDGNDEVFLFETKKEAISQVTISDGGWTRAPRLSATGSYIAFDSNRNYMNLNESRNEKIFILKRGSTKLRPPFTGKMQVIDDDDLLAQGVVQNPKSQLTTIQFDGGMPSSERIGISGNGRMVAFESSQNVGNQEIWMFDRSKCLHGPPECQ